MRRGLANAAWHSLRTQPPAAALASTLPLLNLPSLGSQPGTPGAQDFLHLHTSVALQYAKKGGKGASGGKGGKGAAASPAVEEDEAQEELSLQPYEQMMLHAVSHFQQELGSIHGGRASPGLLEPVEVPAHGEKQPLKNLGAVTARTQSLLVVVPYTHDDADLIAKAIRESPLKLQARVEGKEVHVNVPRPTLDQIKGLVKLVAQEAEKCKHGVRAARQKAMEAVKKTYISAKTGEKGDAYFRAEKQVQTLTDRQVAEIDRLRAAKDKELEALR